MGGGETSKGILVVTVASNVVVVTVVVSVHFLSLVDVMVVLVTVLPTRDEQAADIVGDAQSEMVVAGLLSGVTEAGERLLTDGAGPLLQDLRLEELVLIHHYADDGIMGVGLTLE